MKDQDNHVFSQDDHDFGDGRLGTTMKFAQALALGGTQRKNYITKVNTKVQFNRICCLNYEMFRLFQNIHSVRNMKIFTRIVLPIIEQNFEISQLPSCTRKWTQYRLTEIFVKKRLIALFSIS